MLSALGIILPCLAIVAFCIKPLGRYMACVYDNKPFRLEKWLGGVERLIYRLCGIDPAQEMSWKAYAWAVLSLGLFGFFLLFIIFLSQGILPLNPQDFAGLSVHLAFNAAISFVTNTNWQAYSGEIALSHFSQMAGVAVQNFLSAATGLAVAVALFRGLCRKQT